MMRSYALAAGLTAALFGLIVCWPDNERLPNANSTGTFSCSVTKVHDGDGPIWCAEGPKVRLQAIAARELNGSCRPGHPCPSASGASAQRALERLALGKRLTCEATGSSYDRVTAWCWTPEHVELNCAMVQGGYALRWDKFDRERRLCS